MDSALQFLTLLCRVAAALAVGAGIVWVYRDVRRASRTLGLILACGLLLRIGLGLTLFWIAARHAPILQWLRPPDGYGTFALDAAVYLQEASVTAGSGHVAIPAGFSPDYIVWLTAWMLMFGTSAATAPFFNLTLFALVFWLIVKTAGPVGRDREDLPQIVMAGSFAFSPALLIHGSQALKDDLCAALIAVSCVGARYLFSHQPDGNSGPRRQAIGLLTMLIAGYLLFGPRDYTVGLIGGAALLAAASPWAYRASTWRTLALRAGAVLVVAIGAGAGLWIGAAGDGVAARVESGRQLAVSSGAKALRLPDKLRHSFHKTGGNTNLAPGPVPARGSAVTVLTWPERARALATGIGAIFIPMTVLQATGAVDLGMGPGLRVATDVDTLFLDASILASLVLLVKRRAAARWHLRYVCFVLALGIATTGLMAYVVTNFGTLFRLRIMLAVPIWMLGLAVSREVQPEMPDVRRVRHTAFTNILERT